MYVLKALLRGILCMALVVMPCAAHANIIDSLNLAPFVPMVLDAFMMIATGTYEFFVGNGRGIIYILIWTFLFFSIVFGLLKIFLPKPALDFLGMSGGGDIDSGMEAKNIIKMAGMPTLRAIIASVVLLQLKPMFLTEWLINPFLQLGAVYTHQITQTIVDANGDTPKIECPKEIIEKKWLSPASCEFLIQPVSDLSHANNKIIKQGFDFLARGLLGLLTPIPHGGEDFMNVISGILLIITFVGSNLFMALLIIQGIFNFGIQLILYPFNVLTYVFKSSDKWFDVLPAFNGIIKALQQLIVTMIACAFILGINLAIIKALFNWKTSVFVAAAGGSAVTNMPTVATASNALGFGVHSVTWLSAIMTFFLMSKIFEMTRRQLDMYVGGGMDGLYKQVMNDSKTLWGGAKSLGKTVGSAIGWIKK